jgi:hypothetical protein
VAKPFAVQCRPATADAVEAAFGQLARAYRLPLLWLDWSGTRVSSIEKVCVGDYDEPRRRVRLRKAITKTRKPLWVELPDVLAEAIEATLPPRLVVAGSEGRDPLHRCSQTSPPTASALRLFVRGPGDGRTDDLQLQASAHGPLRSRSADRGSGAEP